MLRPYSATKIHSQEKSGTGTRARRAEVRQESMVQARERAAAEDDGADGAGGFVVGDADVAAAGIFLDGHLGNDGNAHSCADHAEDAAELAALKNDLWMEASAVTGGHGGVAKAVAVAQKKERLLAKILEGERTAARERVSPGKRGKEAFGEEREGFELVAADGQRQNGHVDGAGAQAIEQHRRDFFDDGELRLRELAREGSELRRKKVGSDRGDHADAQRSGDGVFALDDVAPGGFEFAEDGAGAWKKGLAEIGEANRTPEAIEQARAQFVFQLEDLLGERRLRDVRLLGGAAEGAGFGDAAEIAELVKFHRGS